MSKAASAMFQKRPPVDGGAALFSPVCHGKTVISKEVGLGGFWSVGVRCVWVLRVSCVFGLTKNNNNNYESFVNRLTYGGKPVKMHFKVMASSKQK